MKKIVILFIVLIFTTACGNDSKCKVCDENGFKKLKCASSEGSLVLYYDNEGLMGYRTQNLTFDLEVARERVNEIGIEKYIEDFKEWFKENTSGKCE